MFWTQSANWTLVMACVIGLAMNCADFAYGGPASDFRNRYQSNDYGYAMDNRPLYANSTFSKSNPASDLRVANAGSPVERGDEIILFSPPGTLHDAHYSLNGVPYLMKPSMMQRLKNDRLWNVDLDSGTGQVLRYTLAPGRYKFTPTGLRMSIGLFATQDWPQQTTVASATGPEPSELLTPSIGTNSTIAVSPAPMYQRLENWRAHQDLRKQFGEHPAPTITANRWINASHAISPEQFRDKVVLLDFWGIWCGPCVRNLPRVQALYEKYKNRGLIVIGVHSAEGAQSVASFLSRHFYSFPVAVDTGDTARRYGIEALPTYLLIDKSGKQIWRFAHEPPNEQQIENLLK